MARSQSSKSDPDFDELFAARSDKEILAGRLVDIARQQIKTSMEFKRARMEEVQKSLDLYHGKTKKALKGRWNVALPLMSGYADALLSKTDETPKVRYGYQDIADMPRAAKVQAKWEQDSSAVMEKWPAKDRLEKKLATFYGMGIAKHFAYNDSKGMYHSVYEVVDPLDFECEPMGGQFLRDHKFKGQRNIFMTASELKDGAIGENSIYDKKQVLKLIRAYSSEDKTFEKLYQEKTDRMKSLGFDPDRNSYMGQRVYSMTEWYMDFEGTKYYILMEPHTGIWVRFEELKDVFASDEDPFVAWHTHPDPFNFWSKAAADDMRPVAEAMNIIFNQALDNREKKNYGQRAYDPAVFPDPSMLEWRPDGLVPVTEGISGSQAIASGVYSFQIQDMPEAGTINLLKFMDDLNGLKTGITPSAQGESDEKRVGIYFGNLQQVADRLGLYNKSYSEAWGEKGLKYYWGLREHIRSNRIAVKMLGDKGYNWVELVKEDVNPVKEFNIEIVGGQAQVALDEIKKRNRKDSLTAIIANPTLAGRLNPEVTIEEMLRSGDWEEQQIKRLLDTQSYGSEEIIAEAHQAIQDMLENKKPKFNRSATPIFMQTILDFAYDSEDLTIEKFNEMVTYAEMHLQIATQNAMRRARQAIAQMGSSAMRNPQDPNATPVGSPTAAGAPAADPLVSETPLTASAAATRGAAENANEIASDIMPLS